MSWRATAPLRAIFAARPKTSPTAVKESSVRRHIHLDRPGDLSAIANQEVFYGWSTSPDQRDRVSVTINGRQMRVHEIHRPDVIEAYPELHAKGFMFFVEPAEGERYGVVEINLADVSREFRFTLSDKALDTAATVRMVREQHAIFLDRVVVCPMCRTGSPDLRQIRGKEWSCPDCGERYDCSSGLNLIPKSYANYEAIGFGGAVYSHAYDADVEALIRETREMGGMVLDCGAGWRERMRPEVITTEIVQYPSTDIVSAGEHLPFRDGAFDAVLSLHVLEHVKNPFVCAAELMRVLKPGGRFLAVIPYIVGVHGAPFHFFNPTPDGLRALFENYTRDAAISVPRVAHPISALRELLKVYCLFLDGAALNEFKAKTIGGLVAMTADEILDTKLVRDFKQEGMMQLAGNYMVAGRRA
jgi:SAM-dependent methyltransferase